MPVSNALNRFNNKKWIPNVIPPRYRRDSALATRIDEVVPGSWREGCEAPRGQS
jgi:hypothetical protein